MISGHALLSLAWLFSSAGATIDVGFGPAELQKHRAAFQKLQEKINATLELSEMISNQSRSAAAAESAGADLREAAGRISSFDDTYRDLVAKMGKLGNITGEERDSIVGELQDLRDDFARVKDLLLRKLNGTANAEGEASETNKAEDEGDNDPKKILLKAEQEILQDSQKDFRELEEQFSSLRDLFSALDKIEKQQRPKKKEEQKPELVKIP